MDLIREIDIIKNLNKKRDDVTLNIAKHIAYINKCGEFGSYRDIYDLCKNEFGYSKKSVNNFLNVIYFFFTFNEKRKPENILYFVKEGFKDFNYSQLKTLINLDEETIFNVLKITPELSVREIENRRSKFFKDTFDIGKNVNQSSECSEETSDHVDDITKSKRFLETDIVIRLSNDDRNNLKSCGQCVYENKNYNLVTSLKILKTLIEENTEEHYTYAVVRIPKSV